MQKNSKFLYSAENVFELFLFVTGLLYLWIGLEKVDDTWTWNGNLSDPLTEDSVWCVVYGDPIENVPCADTVDCGPTISMNDAHCQHHYLGFICEKPGCYTEVPYNVNPHTCNAIKCGQL